MTQGEVLIAFLLTIITWLLYQIARQLTFLTGRKMKISLFNKTLYSNLKRKYQDDTRKKEKPTEPTTKLPN